MKKLDESGFHLWVVLVAFVVIGAVGFGAWRVTHANKDSNVSLNEVVHQADSGKSSSSGGMTFAQQYQDKCQDTDVKFTSAPLKMEDLGYIRPLGAMLDGHVTPTDHVYVGPKNAQAADNTVPVVMPADGKIVEISRMPDQYIGDRSGTQVAPEDHRIVVSFSCRYYSIFIHVHKLADKLQGQVPGLKANENKRVDISLKAGETFGYVGGATFDWTPLDTKSTLKGFISPKLYESEVWKVNTISPFDLYTGALKKQLEAKSWRTVAPIGGKIDYDQPGKLVGSWFREGTGGYSGNTKDSGDASARYWDGHLSVVSDYVDPSYAIVSIGNWQDKAAQFVVKGSVDPTKISSKEGIVKYELMTLNYVSDSDPSWHGNGFAKDIHPSATGPVAGTIAFQVQSGEKLKVEKFVGKSAAQVSGFTSAAQTYER